MHTVLQMQCAVRPYNFRLRDRISIVESLISDTIFFEVKYLKTAGRYSSLILVALNHQNMRMRSSIGTQRNEPPADVRYILDVIIKLSINEAERRWRKRKSCYVITLLPKNLCKVSLQYHTIAAVYYVLKDSNSQSKEFLNKKNIIVSTNSRKLFFTEFLCEKLVNLIVQMIKVGFPLNGRRPSLTAVVYWNYKK